MANEWVRIRVGLLSNPKVVAMAECLGRSRGLLHPLTTGFGGAFLEIVTVQVACAVVVSGLIRVWGSANEVAKDGVLKGISLGGLDAIAQIPGFGAAMAEVGWARESDDPKGVALPNFAEFNSPADTRGADRQRRFRERKALQAVTRNVTGDVTRNDREEKRREEDKQQKQLPPRARESPVVPVPNFRSTFLHLYPESPHKRYTTEAENIWATLEPEQRERCLAAVQLYAAEVAKWPKTERKYVLTPENWLKGYGPEFNVTAETFVREPGTEHVSTAFQRPAGFYK